MTNAKISEKGKALLKNRAASAKVAKEIVSRGNELAANGSIAVKLGERTVTVSVPK